MKKTFLLFVVAMFSTTTLFAKITYSYKYIGVGNIDQKAYITDISYSPETDQIWFTDVFENSTAQDRKYIVEVYERIPGKTDVWKVSVDENDTYYYNYGYPRPDNSFCSNLIGYKDKIVENSKGGRVEMKLTGSINRAAMEGCNNLFIVISGNIHGIWFAGIHDWKPFEGYRTALGGKTHSYMNCYVNVTIPDERIKESITDFAMLSNVIIKSPYKTLKYKQNYGYDASTQSNPLGVHLLGRGYTRYVFQRSVNEGKSWTTIEEKLLTDQQIAQGYHVEQESLSFNQQGAKSVWYRVAATSISTGLTKADTVKFDIEYPIYFRGETTYKKVAETYTIEKPSYCRAYRVTSDYPTATEIKGEVFKLAMSACAVTINEITPTYTVKFLNADYTVLKTEQVACGNDATAPAEPTLEGMIFRGWNRDFTNVNKNMSVMALYDMGKDFYFDSEMTAHENNRYPYPGFEGSEVRAMLGDSLEFTAQVRTPAVAYLRYQWAYKDNNGEWKWSDPIQAGQFNEEDVQKNEIKTFKQKVAVAYQYYNETAFQDGYAFRFSLYSAGAVVLSDPYEFDVYYNMTIESQVEDTEVFASNTSLDRNNGMQFSIPARDNDTVFIQLENNGADCLQFERTNRPDKPYALNSGIDDRGRAYFICPGETEIVKVSTKRYMVAFEGVWGNGYPIQLDFSAEGFAKINGYYGEIVNCGGSIKNMPPDPKMAGYVFTGWKNETVNEYADDAYLNVPAIDDGQIVLFTAQWEATPDIPVHTVKFYDFSGNLISEQKVNEGDAATEPDIPVVEDYHFVSWNADFSVVTEDLTINALYGSNSQTWTITYYAQNRTDVIGTEEVLDGEAAQGIDLFAPVGYYLKGWVDMSYNVYVDMNHIWYNHNVYPSFERDEFIITYTYQGKQIWANYAEYGELPNDYYIMVNNGMLEEQYMTDEYVYTFDHWNPELAPATEDATYEAVYKQTLRKYTVTFQNWNQTTIQSQEVEYGKTAVAPADPQREGYTFTGWDRDFSNIQTDLTVTALFKQNKDDIGSAIEEVLGGESREASAQKVLLPDGSLYIVMPDGMIYNAQGEKIN